MHLQLIELVKQNKFLYDRREADYKNVWMKERKWKEIADKLGVSRGKIKQKWFNLRDCYQRKKRTMGNKNNSQCDWKYFHHMRFLDELPKRNRRDLFKKINERMTSEFAESIQYEIENCNNTNDSYLSEPKTKYIEFVQYSIPDDGKYFEEEYIEETPKECKKEPEICSKPTKKINRNKKNQNEDGDELFSKIVTSSLGSLSRVNNIKAKTDIFRILEKYVEREETQRWNSNHTQF